MNEGLPLWPPFVALAFGLALYGLSWWENRQLERAEQRSRERRRDR